MQIFFNIWELKKKKKLELMEMCRLILKWIVVLCQDHDKIDLLVLDYMWLYIEHAKNQIYVHIAGQVRFVFLT